MTGAEVTAVTKVALPLVKPVGGWVWRRVRPDTSRPALIRTVDLLADAVARRETVLLDQLRGGPDTVMDLNFQEAPRSQSPEGDVGGVLTDVGPYFRQQVRSQRLVVLGEAGAGKTVLAVHLLLDLLRDRAANARIDAPVPVRVNAAGWDGKNDFTEWLAGRLAIDYELHPNVAWALADAGYILPIVDGLDEMDPPDGEPGLLAQVAKAARAVTDASSDFDDSANPELLAHITRGLIDDSHNLDGLGEPGRAYVALDRLNEVPWRNRAVVVMCRTSVYTRIRELRGDAGLHGATTITLQPLSSIDISEYLHRYGDQLGINEDAWAPIIDQIDHNSEGPLATALRTPWLLGLTATALRRDHRMATRMAACPDTPTIRDLLFAALIPAAVQGTRRAGRTRTYTERNVQTWMYTLVQQLQRQRAQGAGGNEIALDHIWAIAGTSRCRALHGCAVGLTVGLMSGVATGLTDGVRSGVTTGLMFGLGSGLLVGVRNASISNRFAWRVPGRSRWRRALSVGLSTGLTLGLGVGVGAWLAAGLTTGLKSGLTFGLTAGLVFALSAGFVAGLSTNSDERLALGQDARRVIRYDLVAGLVYGLMFGLIGGVVFGLPAGLTHGLAYAIGQATTSLAAGLAAGLVLGLAAGRYATAALLFILTGIFPARPARFLEWARNAGLLRVTGISYQCRHDSYQQWLADHPRSS